MVDQTLSVSSAPIVLDEFTGISMAEQAPLIGFNRVPPDHNGAVGEDHVVSTLNHVMQIFDKQGNVLSTQTLDNLFGRQAGNPTDPNLIYDHEAGRFVYVSFEIAGVGDPNVNRGNDRVTLNVAVSKTGNPFDGWHVSSINTAEVINGINAWSDFPGISVDEDAIYITANMFGFDSGSPFQGNRLWIIDKGDGAGGFYDGGAMAFTRHDPIAEAFDATGLGVSNRTLMPARMPGETPGEFGTFLVAFGGLDGGDFLGGGASPANEYLQIIRIDDPLSAPSFTNQTILLGDIHNENAAPGLIAPQPGGTRGLSAGDLRIFSGGTAWRDETLYATFNVVPKSGPDAGEVTVHWVEIDTANLDSLSVTQQGTIGGEDIAPNTHTFRPSVNANKDGSVLYSFHASGGTVFPGAYLAGRAADDPDGFTGPVAIQREGVDDYVRTRLGEGISNQNVNRWGDYTSVAIDPADDTTFWTFNQIADPGAFPNSRGEDGQWRTTVAASRLTVDGLRHEVDDAPTLFVGGLGRDTLIIAGTVAFESFRLRPETDGAGVTVEINGSGLPDVTAREIEQIIIETNGGGDEISIAGDLVAAGVASVLTLTEPGSLGIDTRDDLLEIAENGQIAFDLLANDSASPGNMLTVSAVDRSAGLVATAFTPAGGGTLTVAADGMALFDPGTAFDALGPGETAQVTFTYTASDPDGETDTASVTLTVQGENDAPVLQNDIFPVSGLSPITGNVLADNGDGADTDAEGDSLTVTLVSSPAQGMLTLGTDGSFTYTATATLTAPDSFVYLATDGRGGTSSATVTLAPLSGNLAPTARPDSFTVAQGALLSGNVLANNGAGADSDPNGDPLSLVAVNGNPASVGGVVITNAGALLVVNSAGLLVYNQIGAFSSLGAGQTGSDSFTYTLSDGQGGTDSTTVSITVLGPPASAGAGTSVAILGPGAVPADIDQPAHAFENGLTGWTETSGSLAHALRSYLDAEGPDSLASRMAVIETGLDSLWIDV